MLPLTETDQQTLLRMAREALVGYLDLAEIPKITEPGDALRQHCGAFVTLRKGKNLRGCIGVIEANKPLYITVRECAVWAALQDPRFPPVTKREVRGSAPGNLRPFPPFGHCPRRHRSWAARTCHLARRPARAFAAASGSAMELGSRTIPGGNLPQSWPAARCVAGRGRDPGFHRAGI